MIHLTKTGIQGFDELLSGGIPSGNAVVLEGAPGTGKTTLAVEFLVHGAIHFHEPGIYVSFEEHPEQIYRDMLPFGFDLQKLEERNLLRIVSISAEIYSKQFQEPNGLMKEMIEDLGCKRIVIDSISLLRFGLDQDGQRKLINQLRNHLRKFDLTSLLILELDQESGTPFEHFLFDGIIRLRMNEHRHNFRLNTLEIRKMRGSKVLHGEHIYRFTRNGIRVIPSYSTVSNDNLISYQRETTGISSLDEILSGGLLKGGIHVVTTDSHSNTLPMMISILSERAKDGDTLLILPSGTYSLLDMMSMYRSWGMHFDELVAEDRLFLVQQYANHIPDSLRDGIFDVHNLSNDEYLSLLLDTIPPIVKKNEKTELFIFYDLNALIGSRGEEWVQQIYARGIALFKELRATVVSVCNTNEIRDETKHLMERTANTVVNIWSDGLYQFLQVQKSSNGKTTPPMVMETTETSPYLLFS